MLKFEKKNPSPKGRLIRRSDNTSNKYSDVSFIWRYPVMLFYLFLFFILFIYLFILARRSATCSFLLHASYSHLLACASDFLSGNKPGWSIRVPYDAFQQKAQCATCCADFCYTVNVQAISQYLRKITLKWQIE